MAVIRIICRDHIRAPRLMRWSAGKATTVANEINQLFVRVCETTDFTPQTSFSPAVPTAGDLVIHFLDHRSASIIRRLTGQQAGTAAGATFQTPQGMVSEVYVGDISVVPRAIANLAFHELMHNKLDAQANSGDRVVQDIHNDGGGGLATGNPIGDGTQLTDRNIELMRGALTRQIAQYSGS
ncbi:MAG: hypothetical protein OEQ28_03920 [Acidobacteriota bacterium]|nr:hypothetical protein [Acidobacteriota bacterium]